MSRAFSYMIKQANQPSGFASVEYTAIVAGKNSVRKVNVKLPMTEGGELESAEKIKEKIIQCAPWSFWIQQEQILVAKAADYSALSVGIKEDVTSQEVVDIVGGAS